MSLKSYSAVVVGSTSGIGFGQIPRRVCEGVLAASDLPLRPSGRLRPSYRAHRAIPFGSSCFNLKRLWKQAE